MSNQCCNCGDPVVEYHYGYVHDGGQSAIGDPALCGPIWLSEMTPESTWAEPSFTAEEEKLRRQQQAAWNEGFKHGRDDLGSITNNPYYEPTRDKPLLESEH